MKDPSPPSRAIDFASSTRVFFSGRYRYRSPSGAFACLVVAALGGSFGYVTLFEDWTPLTWFMQSLRVVLGIASALALTGAAYLAIGFLVNREDSIQITDLGLVENDQLLPWKKIHRVEGVISINGVLIQFCKGSERLQSTLRVQFTPGLTREQYEALARVLIDQVVPFHPHVEINPNAIADTSE